jgi:replicative DNA helicase
MGGLGGGDLGIIFGNPGGGKSWMLVNMGAQAILNGKNVCHYTLELSEDYMGKRYDALLINEDVQTIHKHREQINAKVAELKGKLIIKEFAMGKASISSIESHIQKCTDLGYKPDLIIIDYVDLLKSKRKSIDRKDEIDDIYVSTKGLARELNLPVWSVSQVNRAGAKDNIIEGDKAAGSYDKMMITDVAISLSRKKEDKVNGTGRLHIMKNRYGMDGLSYYMKADTSTGHFQVLSQMDEDDEQNQNTLPPQNNQFSNNISPVDKSIIQQRFFELSKTN